MNRLISVIIPAYNSENTISKTIESVCNQTYGDIEIIIIDDGSVDGTLQVCEGYQKRDHRIRVIHQENKGVSSARNQGIRHAEGDYATFVDSDDVVHPQMIETLYNAIVQYSADIAIGRLLKVDDPFGIEFGKIGIRMSQVVDSRELLKKALLRKVPLYSWGLLVDKRLAAANRFPEGIAFGEDAVTDLKLYEACTKAVIVPDVVYYYVQTKEGASKVIRKSYVDNIISNMEVTEELLLHKVDQKILSAYLCSNYTTAYNYNWRTHGEKQKSTRLLKLIRKCFSGSELRYLVEQTNFTSIMMARLGVYGIALKLFR